MRSNTVRPFGMKSILFPLLILAVVAFAATAQESGPAEPDETEIVIPELTLVVEELGVEEVEAVLPSDEDLDLGQIALPLPGAGELAVSDIAFDAPLPSVSARSSGPEVFSTGRLGAGSSNHIIGDLSIYKLGSDPRFRLGFGHEGIDGFVEGFSFNPAGSGFYEFTNEIDAWLSMEGDSAEFEGTGSFSEHERGLQAQSTYTAVSVRSTRFSGGVDYNPDPLVTITGDIDAGLSTQRLTASGAAAVPTAQEYSLLPTASARFDIRAVDLIFTTSYFLRFLADGSVPLRQDVDFTAGFEATLPRTIVVAGHAGVNWDFGSRLVYPWELSISGVIGDALEMRGFGGFRVERILLSDLWESEALLATSDSATGMLANNGIWNAGWDIRWSGASGLSVRSGMAFTSESAKLDIQAYDTGTDEFPFLQSALMTLTPSVQAAWQPSPVWQFEAGWTGSFLDRAVVDPAHILTGAVRFAERSGIFRADLDVESRLYPQPDVPRLSLAGTLTAGEGVEVVLDFADILSPFLSGGRPRYGTTVTAAYPYIEPGFMATLSTRITL